MRVNKQSFNKYTVQESYKDSNGSGQKNQQQKKEQKNKLKKRRSSKSSSTIFASLNSAELVITPKLNNTNRVFELGKVCSLEHVISLSKLLNLRKQK